MSEVEGACSDLVEGQHLTKRSTCFNMRWRSEASEQARHDVLLWRD